MPRNIMYKRTCKGVQFRIRETGMNWTIDYKPKKSKSWKRIQSEANLNIAKQMVDNQRECRR